MKKYKMAKHVKRSKVTRRRKSQKKTMRKGTRKQQRGGCCNMLYDKVGEIKHCWDENGPYVVTCK